jgi:endo-1,4-beta-D-glucanase Y
MNDIRKKSFNLCSKQSFLILFSLIIIICGSVYFLSTGQTSEASQVSLTLPTISLSESELPRSKELSISEISKTGTVSDGVYPNLFKDLGYSDKEIQAKIDAAWSKLFYGSDTTERVYYPVGTDMAYIKDIEHNDVRSEGMSYGMMIAVQMNRKEEFNRLWKWSKTYMQNQTGEQTGFFAWKVSTDGTKLDVNPASDGEEYFTTALIFAHKRWGSQSTGIYNYKQEATNLLTRMKTANGHNKYMFDPVKKQVVFTPIGDSAAFTNPSYHVPAFYEVWYAFSQDVFWKDVATQSRTLLKNQAHITTGLGPDYSEFTGVPKAVENHADFRFDAWRTMQNAAVDYSWWKIDPGQVSYTNKVQTFFNSKGISSYGNQYTLNGNQLVSDHSPGLVAMNAVGSLASNNSYKMSFVQELWNTQIPTGTYRYYDGMLYMLGMLHVSGKFQAYGFTETGTCQCDLWSVVENSCNTNFTATCISKFSCTCRN